MSLRDMSGLLILYGKMHLFSSIMLSVIINRTNRFLISLIKSLNAAMASRTQ